MPMVTITTEIGDSPSIGRIMVFSMTPPRILPPMTASGRAIQGDISMPPANARNR